MSRRAGALCAALLIALLTCGAAQAAAAPRVEPAAPFDRTATRNAEPPALRLDEGELRDTLASPAINRERRPVVSVMIVGRKTGAPRTTDIPAKLRIYGLWSARAAVDLRVNEDIHFAAKAKSLAQRLEEASPFVSPRVASVTTGAELLAALVEASRQGPITNLAFFGHAAPDALYMMEDRGFYASLRGVAHNTHLAAGTEDDKEANLRGLGARDLADLEALIKSGAIRFAKSAVIVFTGCASAGKSDVDASGVAARMAEITGAATIASIDVTDQSMLYGRQVLDVFYSRGMWVRFAPEGRPERLNTKKMEVLKFMNVADDDTVMAPAPVEATVPENERLYCATAGAPFFGAMQAGFCGVRADKGGVVAGIGQPSLLRQLREAGLRVGQ